MNVLKPPESDGWHIETLRGVAQCGETFAVGEVAREEYEPAHPADMDAKHGTLCTRCHLLHVGIGGHNE